MEFQNHYGWIETGLLILQRGIVTLFQNHYGWIETRDSDCQPGYQTSFKTTTVGLRLFPPTKAACGIIGFKTTTVGLRLVMLSTWLTVLVVSKPLRLD